MAKSQRRHTRSDQLPTTSPEAAQRALQGLSEAGVTYVLLHSVSSLQAASISDVDVAVASEPIGVIRMARAVWLQHGLSPILIWPYDIGGTLTVFLATDDGTEGAQLDMLYDPVGLGRYGLRSHGLTHSAVAGPIPVVSDPARLIYLWRKRVAKGDFGALDALRSEASALPAEDLLSTSRELTGSSETATALLGETESRFRAKKHPLARMRRVAVRVYDPIGYWAHVTDRTIAEELADRMSGYLVVVRTGSSPRRLGQPLWYARHVWPTRLRPGIYVSHGMKPSWCPSPSLVLEHRTANEAAPLLITAMRTRLRI